MSERSYQNISLKTHHSLLTLRNSSQDFSTTLGGHRRYRSAKKWYCINPKRAIWSQHELKLEGRACPCPTSAAHMSVGRLNSSSLRSSGNDCESAVAVDFRVTNFNKQANSQHWQMQDPWIMWINCNSSWRSTKMTKKKCSPSSGDFENHKAT